MNWLFRRHFWIVHLVFLSTCALITAKTASTLLGYWVSKSIPEKPKNRLITPSRTEEPPKDFSLVTERNLFNAKREPVEIGGQEVQTDPGRWQDAKPTTLPLKLISTVFFDDPYDSRAVILNTSTNVARVYSIGACGEYVKNYDPLKIETILRQQDWEPERPCNDIDGLATVVRIEEYLVYVFDEREGKYAYLSLLADDKMPIRERVPMGSEEEVGGGVRKTGPTSYEIDQNEFDKALANVARLMTEARAIPETDSSGNYIGFKIVYLKEGSLFEKIGIERMDIITRINGYDLNSPEKALQLFGKLKTASAFTIDLKRGDRSMTLDYSIR